MANSERHANDPRVAIVTVSYGSAEVLADFLRSVPGSSADPVITVVVDNRGNDAEVARLAAEASALYVSTDHNLGYGHGMNLGVENLPQSVDWVLISNPDVILEPGSLDVLVEAGEQDNRVAAVGPAIITDGEIYPSARSVPSLRTGVGHALFANIWIGNPWTRAYRRDTEDAPVRRDAGWLSGACVLVRRATFDELGGFDTGYFMYFEDVDLGYRIGLAGYRNIYEPTARITHSGAHSTNSESAQMIAVHHQSARRFLDRKYSGWRLWPVRAALSVGLAMRSAALRRRSGHH